VKERVRVKARESLSFPPTAYPPPLFDGTGERREREREKEEEEEEEEERKNERKEEMARARETQHRTAKELSAILFYLSRLLLDRIHRFLTLLLSPLLRIPVNQSLLCLHC